MKVHLLSNQPLLSQSLLEICGKICTQVTHSNYSLLELTNFTSPAIQTLIIVESKSSQVPQEVLLDLGRTGTTILIVKNCFSNLNAQALYKGGIRNIVTSEDCEDSFRHCLSAALINTPYLSPAILTEIGLLGSTNANQLSKAEIDIIKMSWAEKRNKEIANLLCLSVRTIENKRVKIKEKYSVDSFTGVFKKAIKEGLIQL